MNKLILLASLFLATNAFAAIDFTGFADIDFPDENCLDDPGGQDVGIPNSYPILLSGFDIDRLCLQYDSVTDDLYVGVVTQTSAETGELTVFGDADNNGEAGNAGSDIIAVEPTFMDPPDIGQGEYFALAFDFNNDQTADFAAGVTFTKDINGFIVAEAATPPQPLALAFNDAFYGTPIETSSGSSVAFSPDMEHPSLEFTITNLSLMPNFNDNGQIGLFFIAGSLVDGGIGEDAFGNATSFNSVDFAEISAPQDPENTEQPPEAEGEDQQNDQDNDDNDVDDPEDDTIQPDPDDSSSEDDPSSGQSEQGEDSGGGGICSLNSAVTFTSSAFMSGFFFLIAPALVFIKRSHI